MGKEEKEKKEKKEKKSKDKKEKKEKEDKKEKKEKEDKKEKKEKEDKKEKKEKEDKKEKADENKEEKKPEPKKDEKKPEPKKDEKKPEPAARKSSIVSTTSKTGGEVIPYTPVILSSDNDRQGRYMVKVSLEDGTQTIEGPETVYGWTEDEVKLAALLRREQMRQRHFDKIPLREFIRPQDADRAGALCHADFFDPSLSPSQPFQADGRGGYVRPYPGSPKRQILHNPSYGSSPSERYPRGAYSLSPERDAYSPSRAGSSEFSEGVGRCGALRAAAACGDAPGVLDLLRGGYMPVNDPRPGDAKTALHHAARYGHVDVVDVLLEAGADPHQPDAKHRTPLDYARQYGQREAARRMEVYRPPAYPGAGPNGGAQPYTSQSRPRSNWNPPGDRDRERDRDRRDTKPFSPYTSVGSNTGGPRAAMSGTEARRRLQQDVQHGMTGMASMVKSWIHEWPEDDMSFGRADSPPHSAPYRPYVEGAGAGAFPGPAGVRAYEPPAPAPAQRVAGPPPPGRPVSGSVPVRPPVAHPSAASFGSGLGYPSPAGAGVRGPYAQAQQQQQQPYQFGAGAMPPHPFMRDPAAREGAAGGERISPPRPSRLSHASPAPSQPPLRGAAGGAAVQPQHPQLLDELTAKIWAAAGGAGAGPSRSASPAPAARAWGAAPTASRPAASQEAAGHSPGNSFLLPTDGVDI